jgi:hypothetical protein
MTEKGKKSRLVSDASDIIIIPPPKKLDDVVEPQEVDQADPSKKENQHPLPPGTRDPG